MRSLIESEFPNVAEMPEEITLDYYEIITELDRLNRIHKCETDLLRFSYEYFSDDLNPGNDGNWIPAYFTEQDDGTFVGQRGEVLPRLTYEDVVKYAPEFHREICEMMDEVSHVRRNDKVGVAAPRSHAKSSFLSKAYPIREVVYRLRNYIIIISETPSVSTANLEWISEQLKHNEKLRADFGALLSPKDQANIKDNSEEFIAWHGDEKGRKRQIALVQAASTGQRLRGRNWNGNRPDLVICDDLEDANTNAATPEQRKKLREWFSQVVVPLGDPKGEKTAIVYMGTTVHHASLLIHILYRRSDFRTKLYRAIIKEPDRQDLWEECRQIYVDRQNPKRAEDARKFYEERRSEMDGGSELLWPDVQPLFKLMAWKWDNGSKAFNTEYQNNPLDEESMIFNPDTFTYWTDNASAYDFTDRRRYEISLGIDFAMGKKRGDYSAIAVVAHDTELDVFYEVESYGDRIKPDLFIGKVVEKVNEWLPDKIAAEAQAAQEFFVDQLKRALQSTGYPAETRVEKVYQRSRKDMRIEAMLPDIESGRVQFNKNSALLLEQFERYGTGEHDDLPDALEQAISVLKTRKSRVVNKPTWWRY